VVGLWCGLSSGYRRSPVGLLTIRRMLGLVHVHVLLLVLSYASSLKNRPWLRIVVKMLSKASYVVQVADLIFDAQSIIDLGKDDLVHIRNERYSGS
jgi:NAD kinase